MAASQYERFLDVESDLAAFTPPPREIATKALHSGAHPSEWASKSVVPPIHQGCTFELDDIFKPKYYYTRFANPSRDSLARVMAALDDGTNAIVTSSGMGAISTLLNGLKVGDHVLLGFDIYEATYRLFHDLAPNLGIQTDAISFLDLEKVRANVKPNTRLVFFETLTNPLQRLADIPALVSLIKGINPEITVVVDNAFLTPYFCRPLTFGADIVMYSVSKFYNGHSDSCQGALVFKNETLYQKYLGVATLIGVNPGPFDCYLVERAIRTLHARMPLIFRNAMIVAKFLEQHPAVEKVVYAGLKSYPEYERATRLLNGASGIVTIYLRNGNLEKVAGLFKRFKVIMSAGSLGGVESTITCPCIAAAKGIPADLKRASEITESLLRLSVGMESALDLVQDLDQALNSLL